MFWSNIFAGAVVAVLWPRRPRGDRAGLCPVTGHCLVARRSREDAVSHAHTVRPGHAAPAPGIVLLRLRGAGRSRARQAAGQAHRSGQQHRGHEDQVDNTSGGVPVELVGIAGERDGQQHGEHDVPGGGGPLADGASNPDISKTLYISRRTAEHHVEHILAKLDVTSRTAAVAHALTHDLLS
jgi:Bacterial regulatory proteins, luxR family